MEKNFISKAFLLFLIIAVIYACYKVFEPFLVDILVAAILVSVFYSPYEALAKIFGGRKRIAALVMCILLALVIIIPAANFIAYAAQRSVEAYGKTVEAFDGQDIEGIIRGGYLEKFNVIGIDSATFKDSIIEVAKKLNNWIVSGATSFIKGTTNFIISLVLIIFTMFFFFVDGKEMLERLMHITPLSDKYDKALFKKFRDVSSSTMISTFVTAITQGLIGAIGFVIVGVPAFFAGIAMAFLSLLPYVGAALIWFPVGLYLIITGKIWQGIFLLAIVGPIVSTVDNLIRAYLIKGKAEVHPIFIIFSILGGIALFGFWGIIFGPLIISLAVTVLHIYEMEYGTILEK